MTKAIDVFSARIEDGEFKFDQELPQFANGCTISGIQHFPHTIEYDDKIFQILYTEKLTGEVLERMENDWRRYCSK